MRKILGLSLILSLCSAVAMPIFAKKVEVASAATTPTGYTKASDVNYKTVHIENSKYAKGGDYIANWGARDEDCVFLSSYATSFYTGSYSYDQMSLKAGGSSTSTAPSSALYTSLKSMMSSKQTYETSYDKTRGVFCITDCEKNNYTTISSFYSGKAISGTWDGGSTWNREHTWPNSKGDANGNGENDIMMLRPASVSENSSRGNKAYGESSGYYDPNSLGQNVRGDCARIMLFVYTRWNSANMWGSSGVMENLTTLLKWMKEDPVDTWEMGRNDAVQSITGTRNVFVDYPEYAWMLFGKSVPTDMVTPSGKASGGVTQPDTPKPPVVEDCEHSYGAWTVVTPATTESEGLKKHTCSSCGHEETATIPKLEVVECEHRYGAWTVVTPATTEADGLQKHACRYCGYEETEVIPKLCNHRYGAWTVVTPATTESEGLQKHSCRYCGYEETEVIPQLEGDPIPDGSDVGSDVDSTSDSVLDSDVDSALDSDADSISSSEATSDADSDSDSETDGSNDSLDSIINSADSVLDSMAAGCQAVVGLPMLGMAILALGGALLKRKNDKE